MSRLSIIVPVYNEAQNLEKLIERFMSIPMTLETEWIFVDDCSTDHSLEILREQKRKHLFRLLEQGANQGKGAAVIRGIQEATGTIIMVQDADWEYDPHDIPSLLVPLIEDRADVVYGSRFRHTSPQIHRTYHYFINRFLTMLSNLFSGVYLSDMETCYKIFRADLLKSMKLKSRRFGIEVELTAYIAKTRARIFELPISYHPRTHLEGKKIGWKDGVAALGHLIRFNLATSKKDAFHQLPSAYQ